MPVPVSITNPQGKGLVAHNVVEVKTDGPFARFAKKQAQEGEAGPQATSTASQPQEQAPAANGASVNGHSQAQSNGHSQQANSEPSIAVHDLTFSYPGLGALAPGHVCTSMGAHCAAPAHPPACLLLQYGAQPGAAQLAEA